MWYKFKEIQCLLNHVMKDFWPYNLIGGESMRYILDLYFIVNPFMVTFSILGVTYCSGSLPVPIFISSERLLPFPTLLPFDWSVTPYYQLIYIIQIIFITLAVLMVGVGTDLFVLGICSCVTSQFKILQHCFLLLETDQMIEVNKKLKVIYKEEEISKTIDTTREYFVRCIKHHQLLLRFTKLLNDALNPIELGQLLLSIGGICLGSFILSSGVISGIQFAMISVYTFGFGVQLGIDCMIGNELCYQASLIPEYILKSNWMNVSTSMKTDLIFVIQHSQRIQKLTAYNLYDMNMSSFLKVMRLTFSLYTVLNTVLQK